MRRNAKAGVSQLQGFGVNVFTDDELYEIHLATLEVLWKTGIKVEHKKTIEIFEDGGATVDYESRMVKIPSHMIEEALRSAPRTVYLAGRNPKNDFVMDGKRVGFVNFGEGIAVIDPFTREHRKSTKQDVANTALLMDALDEVDCYLRAVASQDVPAETAPLHNAEAFFANTSKHCFLGCVTGRNARKVIEMAEAIVGGKQQLRDRPIFSVNVCPTSPLEFTNSACEVILECSKAGIAVNILSMAMAGATSPISLAGTLVVHNAEVLAGVVLTQLVRKGAPVIYGSSTTIMDLRFTTSPVGAPELGMLNAALTKMAQFYLIPSWVAGG